MDTVIYIIAGLLFLGSAAGHLYVRIYLQPREGSDLDDWYYEFEEGHPAYARYLKWSRITFVAAAVGVLLFFLAAVM